MRDPLARMVQSGLAPGEDKRRLAGVLDHLRERKGILVYPLSQLDGDPIAIEQHKAFTDNLRRQANLEEKAANGR